MSRALKKVVDDPSRIEYRYSPGAGWFFALMGLALLLFAASGPSGEGDLWLVWAMGAVSLAVGGGLALYRSELSLDLQGRRIRFRKGMPWSSKRGETPLDELREIRLRQEWETRGSGKNRRRVCTWEIHLDFPEPLGRVKVFDGTDEGRAFEEGEALAERIGRPLVDLTSEDPRRIEADELDLPLGDRLAAAADADAVPEWAPPRSESGIVVQVEAGRRLVTLPARSFGCGFAFMVLFSLAFVGMGSAAVLAAFGYVDSDDSPLTLTIVGGLFVATGLFVLGTSVVRARTREWIRDEGNRVVIGRSTFGVQHGVRSLSKRSIEDVGLVGSSAASGAGGGSVRIGNVSVTTGRNAGSATEVRVRSDEEVARLGGTLSGEDREWLCSALVAMVAR